MYNYLYINLEFLVFQNSYFCYKLKNSKIVWRNYYNIIKNMLTKNHRNLNIKKNN